MVNNRKLTRDQIVTDLDSLLRKAEEEYQRLSVFEDDGGPEAPANSVEIGKMIAYRRAIDLLLQGD